MPNYRLKCEDCGREIEEALTAEFMATGDTATLPDVTCECGSQRFVRLGGEVPARTPVAWFEAC